MVPRPRPVVALALGHALLFAALGAGCATQLSETELALRVENRSEGAVGLWLEVRDADNVTVYRSEVVVRQNEVALHATPVGPGTYTLVVELRRGPGLNREADWGSLPPADDRLNATGTVDTLTCPDGAAVLEVRLERGPALEAVGPTCLAR